MEDPLPNELDNALSQLIPAVKNCSDPSSPAYRSLDVFEKAAGTTPSWKSLAPRGQEPGIVKA